MVSCPPPLRGNQNTCRECRIFFLFHSSLSIPPYVGLYIGWRCPHYLWDCFRIGDESRCFCGHLLKEHQIISGRNEVARPVKYGGVPVAFDVLEGETEMNWIREDLRRGSRSFQVLV